MREKNNLSGSRVGHYHPVTLSIREIHSIFDSLGFQVVLGPELETEFYNFDALNVPADHPSRDMQDTFWTKHKNERGEKLLLRTQTSAVQVRFMEDHPPPLKVIVPGKVFRNEATDATHELQFYQVEGLYVDTTVNLAQLKGTLEYFLNRFFGERTVIRFRPSFFPFTEPSVEVDSSCWFCRGGGCSICKQTGWIELGGAGMVHPAVFRSAQLDPTKWRGFAFGFGLERLLMLKHGVNDVRTLYNGDLRLVHQF